MVRVRASAVATSKAIKDFIMIFMSTTTPNVTYDVINSHDLLCNYDVIDPRNGAKATRLTK